MMYVTAVPPYTPTLNTTYPNGPAFRRLSASKAIRRQTHSTALVWGGDLSPPSYRFIPPGGMTAVRFGSMRCGAATGLYVATGGRWCCSKVMGMVWVCSVCVCVCVWVTVVLYVASLPGRSAASSLATRDGRAAALQFIVTVRLSFEVSAERRCVDGLCLVSGVVY